MSRFVKSTDGTVLYTCSAGDPTRTAHTVIFVPGLCCTALAFQKQLEDHKLTESVLVIAYDVRGQGRSGQPVDASAYTSEWQAEDFRAVCEAYAVDRPVLAGWSLGGVVASDVVSAYGTRYLRGVVLLSGFPHANMISTVDEPEAAKLVPDLLSNDVEVFYKACHAWVESCVVDPTNEDVLPYSVKMSWIGALATQNPHARRRILERTQDESALLAAVQTGALRYLVIQGEKDCHIRWAALKEWLGTHVDRRLAPDNEGDKMGEVKWVLLSCGHAPFWEQPERVREEMLDWLGSLPDNA